MNKRDLLPGVDPDGYEPAVVCDTRAVIRRARRIAAFRDAAQLLIVLAVDVLMMRWPHAHIPSFAREASLTIVAFFNILAVFHVVAIRKWPQWSAKRIANTWCPTERKRFATLDPRRATR